MMQFAVISVLPDMFDAIARHGVVGRAFETGLSSLIRINPRDYAEGHYRRVDERPAGGGPGMVMMAEPLSQAICAAKQKMQLSGAKNIIVVYLSPQGNRYHEGQVASLLELDGIVFLCGRYEGVDQRIIDHYVDQEWSLGDYVISGGELAAMVIIDSLVRRLPGVLQDETSAVEDSFVDGLLDCPHYTKPDDFEGHLIPDVLRSGHHEMIAQWRFIQRYECTQQRRPDLIAEFKPNRVQQRWLEKRSKI